MDMMMMMMPEPAGDQEQQDTQSSQLHDLLNQAEGVLSWKSLDDLEPTPIGPNAFFWNNPLARTVSSLGLNDMNTMLLTVEPIFSASDCHNHLLPPQNKKRRIDGSPSFDSNRTLMPLVESCAITNQEESIDGSSAQLRQYQSDQWNDRFQELLAYKLSHGHCCVAHSYPDNQKLAQWVKRQRYQYKLKKSGRHSTLTDERLMELEGIGFVWDSHVAAWDERFESLRAFQLMYGHCNVPSHYEDKSLAVWVKCQRRQMKLRLRGQKSTLNESRIDRLDRLPFEWNPRNL